MIIDPAFLYGVAIIVVCLIAMLVAICVLYIRVNKALLSMNTEFTLYKRDTEGQAKAALDSAEKKAQELIADTKLFTEQMKASVLDSVNKSIANGNKTYEQIVSDLGKKSTQELIEFSKELENTLSKETKGLTAEYQKQLVNEEKAFQENLHQGEVTILNDFKTDASKMLKDVLADALQKSISQEEAEKYILDSLEKIKKQHGLA